MYQSVGGEIMRMKVDELVRAAADESVRASVEQHPMWRLRIARRLVAAGARLVGQCADELQRALDPNTQPGAALR